MSDFLLDVIEVVKLIPKGRVTTYGRIAKYLGSVKSSRAVGWALNNIKLDETIPAHRVVNRNGLLTGKHFFSGSNLMRELLESEGIKIENDKIVDFEHHFWNPST